MHILIASNNQHKIEELELILPGYQLIPAGKYFPDFDPDETGSDFAQNSIIKAVALHRRAQKEPHQLLTSIPGGQLPPILADDSGICIDALDGKPGIYSARFGHAEAGRKLSSNEQNDLLLEKLSGVSGNNRSARYICCMTLLYSENRFYQAQESWEGLIAESPSLADGGFGYDPIFHLPDRGCTVADISPEDKRRLSHRGKATVAIARFLNQK